MASDITENIPVDLSSQVPVAVSISGEQSIHYDVEIAGIGFTLAPTEQEPYRRQTAQYRKDQQDNSIEPGEQSLTGWWLRSQSSFHLGAGIKFYEPAQELGNDAANQRLRFQYADSEGVNVWENGQVTLLKSTSEIVDSSTVNCMVSTNTGIIYGDGQNLKSVVPGSSPTSIVASHGYNYISLTTDGILNWSACSNHIHRGSTTVYTIGSPSNNIVVGYEKQYLLAGVAKNLYVLDQTRTTSTSLPVSAYSTGAAEYILYTNPNNDWVWTSITSNGSVIYAAGYSGNISKIYKITINPEDLLLSAPVVVAELPTGELTYTIKSYLGFLLIGTNKGLRVAQVTTDDGDIIYGPLVVETEHDVLGIASFGNYVWFSGGTGHIYRVDLSNEIGTLSFPYAKDLAEGSTATSFVDVYSSRIIFSVDSNGIFAEDISSYVSSGYITTGRIRYNTLENKLFKFITDRALFNLANTISISAIDKTGTEHNIGTVDYSTNGNDILISPSTPQEFLQFKFVLTRGAVTTETPTFYGYQIKALPAAKRQRLVQYPVFNFDTEIDKYNNTFGYEDRAYAVLSVLEQIEEAGDIVLVKDFRTNEQFNALIEEISYVGDVSSDRKFKGFGGKMLITVRKI